MRARLGNVVCARRATFDLAIKLVEDTAPAAAPPAGGPRATLQSDTPPPRVDQQITAGAGDAPATFDGPDAYEANKDNPHLGRYMKAGGLTADNVRNHGPKGITVIPELQQLIDNSSR